MADGTLKVGTITTSSGSGTITIGQSGETISVPSGVTMSGMGKVLQVVQTVFTGAKSTTSTSLTDVSGASVSITPSSTSSKVLVFVHANDSQKGNDSAVSGTMALLRGSTQLIQLGGQIGYTGAANYNNVGTVSAMYLDSPATTSATTYKLQFSTNTGNTFYINANSNTDSMITAVEIAGW